MAFFRKFFQQSGDQDLPESGNETTNSLSTAESQAESLENIGVIPSSIEVSKGSVEIAVISEINYLQRRMGKEGYIYQLGTNTEDTEELL
jgi:hypothetical protein